MTALKSVSEQSLGSSPSWGMLTGNGLSDKSFDFLIGSTHLVDRFDPYYPDFWTSYDAASGVNRYLDVTLQNIRAFDDFDVYGHIDYIIRYVPDGDRVFSYKKHADQVDAVLKLLIENGKGNRNQHRRATRPDFLSQTPVTTCCAAIRSSAGKSLPWDRTPIRQSM